MKKIIITVISAFFLLFSWSAVPVKAEGSLPLADSVPAKKCIGLPTHHQLIKFPAKIKSVDRLLSLDTKDKKILLVVKESDNKVALWSYAGGKFTQVLKPKQSVNPVEAFIHSVGPYLYFEINNPQTFYQSADNGKTWKIVASDKEVFWSMAQGADNFYYGTAWSYNSPDLYISDKNGLNWKPWKNFQQIFPEYNTQYDIFDSRSSLRHLHDLVMYKNNILVGTGDMARFTFLSQDNGINWKEVWNEGFTAHLLMPNNKVLLGGDRAQNEAVIYDFGTQATTTAWSAKKFGWSGYVYSLLAKDNKYFLASHIENGIKLKYGVMGSCDGLNWQPLWELKSTAGLVHNAVYLADGPGKIIYLSLDGKFYQLY